MSTRPGFSQSQLRRLGDLVLGQRGGLRKVEAALQERAFAWQVLCLRLAIIVCHARDDVDAGGDRLGGDGGTPTTRLRRRLGRGASAHRSPAARRGRGLGRPAGAGAGA